MKFYTMASPAVMAAALCVVATSAQAQTAPPASADPTAPTSAASGNPQEGDIIVTATRQETRLQNTPVAVTALSAKTLEQRGVQTLLDVANYVPNVVIGGRGNQGTAQGGVAIRGIGSDAPDSSPSVGIYIDDVYYPSVTGNLLGLFDVARVEVLRGPQGTLFGRNTIAGAIQYVSVKPSVNSFGGFAFGSLGTLNSYEASGAINVPLGSTLAVRVAGQVQQQGGYVRDQLNNFYRGKTRTDQGRVQVRWQPVHGLTVDLKAETAEINGNGRPAVNAAFQPGPGSTVYLIATGVIPVLPPFLTDTQPFKPNYVSAPGSYSNGGFNGPDYFNLRYNAANGVVAYDISDDIRVKSITGYSFTRSFISTDFDGTPLAILSANTGQVRTSLFTQELQLTGNSFNNRLHWTTGVYYYSSRQRTTGASQQIGLAAFPPNPESTLRTYSYAAYGQATFDIVSGISATAGLRYSNEVVHGDYTGGAFPSSRQRFTDTSPYFGLNWQATPDFLLYAKASKGFRAGGYHLDPLLTANPAANQTAGSLFFAPETAWTYEAGARLQFLDRRLRINPTIFLTDWKNIQFVYIITPPAGGAIAATRNAGDARMKGFELESQFAVTRALQLTGTFSYLDAKYTRLQPSTAGSVPTVLSLSDPLARAPKFKYSVGARYTIDLHDGAQIVPSVDYAWTDNQRSAVDGDQAVTLPRYGLLNARVEITPPGKAFTFALYATNLTNKYYLIDAGNFQSNTATQVNTLGRPREFYASARVRF